MQGHDVTMGRTATCSFKVVAALQPGQQLPEGFSQQTFGSLFEQPLCSLYVPSSTEGFTGVCQVSDAQCTDSSRWCDGGSNPDSDAVEELIALQLTKVCLASCCFTTASSLVVPVCKSCRPM